MAESFLSASFGFACDNAEMDLLAEAFQAASDLMVDFDPGEPSAALLALFPPTQDGTPWSGLRDIFDDPAFPDFGAEVASDPCAKEPGRRSVVIYGLVDFQRSRSASSSSVAARRRSSMVQSVSNGP